MSSSSKAPLQVCMVGSGNFACSIVRNVGKNVSRFPGEFKPNVKMWVFEEQVQDDKGLTRNLSDVINESHENVKYLPDVKLPQNVWAEPDLRKAAEGADVIIFCLPHQFIEKVCRDIRDCVNPSAKAISLIKGFHQKKDESAFSLISDLIASNLGVSCAVLMGANLADEVAKDLFCESTVGDRDGDQDGGNVFKKLLQTEKFRIQVTRDAKAVEMCGALKNIVAIAAGMMDGMNVGNNAKAAIIRLGMIEMVNFVRHLDPDARMETFFESCGLADLMTTCYGGRNRKLGEAFVTTTPRKTLAELERDLLNGQKLQGPMTAAEVAAKLDTDGIADRFPLLITVHRVCNGDLEPEDLLVQIQQQPDTYGSLVEEVTN